MTYRMSIPATVCVDVEAESDDEARAKALEIASEFNDGLDVRQIDGHARLYLNDSEPADIEDVDSPDTE